MTLWQECVDVANILPNWLLTKNMTLLTMTGVSIAADGTATDGTARSILVQIKTDELRNEATTEELSASSSGLDNYVKISQGTFYDFEGIQRGNDTVNTQTINAARYIKDNFDYVKISRTQGGINTSAYFLIKNFKDNNKDKGGVMFSFSLEPCDVGALTVVVS